MDYDVLILGGGIIGCSVAYELSKYNLNIALIEKDYDVVDETSQTNTSVIYDGFESGDDSTALLEKEGSEIIEEACKKFNVEMNKVGALRIATTIKEVERIKEIFEMANRRGIHNTKLIDGEEAKKIDKGLKDIDVKMALYSENIFSINPYDLTLAYGEVAFSNGVKFRFNETVQKIEKITKGFKVTTNKNRFTCKIVVNTIINDLNIVVDNNPLDSNLNQEKEKMTYLLVNEMLEDKFDKVIIKKLDDKKSIMSIPGVCGRTIISIRNCDSNNKDEILSYARNIYPKIKLENLINIFTQENNETMVIDYRKKDIGYIRVTGNNYSKVTLAPAVSKIVTEAILSNVKANLNKNYIDKRREIYVFRNMTNEERNELIKVDKRYGNIICLCNQITEGEIIDCIRRPLGARTLDGVKKRIGTGLGSCYGSYCTAKIIKILAREMDKKPDEITKDSEGSRIWISRIKEFETV